MKQYNILILSNMVGSGLSDDTFVKDAFLQDGHKVQLVPVDYDPKLDDTADLIIRRNTWVSKEEDTDALFKKNHSLIQRLTEKNLKTVNLIGLDGVGKGYLCDMYENGLKVIPTIHEKTKLSTLPKADNYVSKNIKSFGSGLHQQIIPSSKLETDYTDGDILQPFMDFSAEIQCYYAGNKLLYVFEYTPSKFPDYPEPNLIQLNPEEKMLADHFASYSQLNVGFQRIDFLRLKDNTLLLMEIEDHAAFMNLGRLEKTLLEQVMSTYKSQIYHFLKNE